ncbi:hypothetical protein LCGC14_0432820 [marine sediment metagenome]|uniref:Uncharacterized protein n=1 Tax=marine sediment metagenome TaxID=412755 RepID=A0A0F9T5R2_9ZZZZ
MMVSKVSIISNVFILLGKPPVSDVSNFNTGNPIHAAASTWYDVLIGDFFSGPQPWRFAVTTQTLRKLTESAPPDDWENVFQLPTDPAYKMLVKVYSDSNYLIYEDKIYSNQSTLKIDYVFQPDASTFPSYFEIAVIYKLAASIGLLITQQKGIVAIWAAESKLQEKKARYIDSKVNPNGVLKAGEIYRAHFADNIRNG